MLSVDHSHLVMKPKMSSIHTGSPDGLCMPRVKINDDGMVQYEGVETWVDIAPVDVFLDIYGEVYVDSNGIEVPVEKTIANMVLTEPQYDNLQLAQSYATEQSTSITDNRVRAFSRILQNRLAGVVDVDRRSE